jgi:hypothetical protein
VAVSIVEEPVLLVPSPLESVALADASEPRRRRRRSSASSD